MGLIDYIKETRAEMTHVSWPTRTQAIVYTSLVIIISLLVAVYIGAFDFLFRSILERYLTTVAPTVPQTQEVDTENVDDTQTGQQIPDIDFDSVPSNNTN